MIQIKKQYCSLLFLMISVLCLSACSGTKQLQEGQNLYVKGQVTLVNDSIPTKYKAPLVTSLEELLRPKPNLSFLGSRPKLAIYNATGGSKAKKGWKKWIQKKAGEEPVLLTDVNREYNELLIKNRLENTGFFNAEISSDTTILQKKAVINYTAITHHIYRINKVTWPTDTSALARDLTAANEGSLLRPGRIYNLDNIINERLRIDKILKQKGYFFFSPDHLIVQVDSTIGDHKVNMHIKIKDATPKTAYHPYTINNVFIYPEYTIQQGDYILADPNKAENYRGYYFIDPNNTFKRFALARTMFFHKGDTYQLSSQNNTINQLVGLGTFRFVKSNFYIADSAKNTLDIHYYLTPNQKKALRAEVLGKTAAVYNGAELNLSWSHRNAFRAAELLRVSGFFGYEVQSGGGVNINSNFYRYGLEGSITWPRIIAPFKWNPTRSYVPNTSVLLGLEFLNRTQAYRLNSVHAAWSYVWQETAKKEHSLSVIDAAYVQPINVTPLYDSLATEFPSLARAIERQFTFGPIYKFTYTNTIDNSKRNTNFFRGTLDLSGNIYGLLSKADYHNNLKSILNANYSQYIKTELEYRHFYKLGRKSNLAGRVDMGYGYSYGNSRQLPYVKQFFAGGPNGIRAFQARTLGPGSYQAEQYGSNNFILDMTGDIKIEANLEYRANIAGFLNWAAFVDAGNIWLQHADAARPGAEFTKDFYKQIAVGGGLGLRFDFTYLILRTDFAIPLRLPYLSENENWVFNQINFRDPTWRTNNIVFNLAIGYPF